MTAWDLVNTEIVAIFAVFTIAAFYCGLLMGSRRVAKVLAYLESRDTIMRMADPTDPKASVVLDEILAMRQLNEQRLLRNEPSLA